MLKFLPVFSLKQMEQNVIDMNKVEEETKEKIAAVNDQKVAIVTAFMAQMKVSCLLYLSSSLVTAHLYPLLLSCQCLLLMFFQGVCNYLHL